MVVLGFDEGAEYDHAALALKGLRSVLAAIA